MTDTASNTINRTLPRRLPNSAYRVREYLTEKEVDRLIEVARKRGRNGARDAAAILQWGHPALRRSSPRKRGPRLMDCGPWIPAISAFTRVFDALCAGMSGILLHRR